MIESVHYSLGDRLGDLQLPIRLHERPAYRKTLGLLGGGLFLGALIVLPPAMMLGFLFLSETGVGSLAFGSLNALTLIASVGLGVLVLALLVPSLARRIGRRRVITINAREVWVQEKRLFGLKEWREPLSSFSGVDRETRATIGGWQQKVVLSHRDPNRVVPVWVGEREPDGLVAGYEDLLAKAA